MPTLNVRVGGVDMRGWISSEPEPLARDGEWGYHFDTQRIGIRINGTWQFWDSPLLISKDIKRLLEEAAERDIEPRVVDIGYDLTLLEELLKVIRDKTRPGKTTDPLLIPEVGTSTYTAGDAFGDKFTIPMPVEGDLIGAQFFDRDDEGVAKILWLFREDFTATTVNSALDISDSDLINSVATIRIPASAFVDGGSGQLGTGYLERPVPYEAPNGQLWCQVQTEGGDAIATGNAPSVALLYR